jgi:hypothetical protein
MAISLSLPISVENATPIPAVGIEPTRGYPQRILTGSANGRANDQERRECSGTSECRAMLAGKLARTVKG